MLRGYEEMRYDRILARLAPTQMKLTQVKIVANERLKLPNSSTPVFPSDHFGLLLDVALL